MNLSEVVQASSTSATSVSGTITAAADTVLICFVAAAAGVALRDALVGPAGWTNIPLDIGGTFAEEQISTSPARYLAAGVWWKANVAAGDVTAEVSCDETCEQMLMRLLEVSGGDKVDDKAARDGETDGRAGGPIPATASNSAIAVSREGNLGVFAMVVATTKSTLTEPTGYAVDDETDAASGDWCVGIYTKPLPFATYLEAQAAVSGTKDYWYGFWHLECDVTVSAGSLMGDF